MNGTNSLSILLFWCLQSGPLVAVFYPAYFLFTNFIILNLVIASALEQFVVRDSEKRSLQRRRAIREVAAKQVRC